MHDAGSGAWWADTVWLNPLHLRISANNESRRCASWGRVHAPGLRDREGRCAGEASRRPPLNGPEDCVKTAREEHLCLVKVTQRATYGTVRG